MSHFDKRKFARIALNLILFAFGLLGAAAPSYATTAGGAIQGTLFDPSGNPVVSSSVNFKVQILDKAATCVLYEESHLGVDLSQSAGDFSFDLGYGSASTNNVSGGGAIDQNVFRNDVNLPVSVSCPSGVTFADGDERMVRVQFDVGGGFNTLSPDIRVAGGAYAAVAQTVQGKAPGDFIQVVSDGTTALTQANESTIFSINNYNKLLALLAGTSSQYQVTAPTAAVSENGQRVSDVGAPTSATDAATRGYADTNLAGHAIDVSAIGTASGNGDTLLWSSAQNKWVAGALALNGTAGGDLSGSYPSPTVASSAINTAKLADNAVTSAKLNATGVAVNRLLITDNMTGTTVTYATCTLNQVMAWTATGWACTNAASLAAVTSVAGKTGAVTLNAADVAGLGTAAILDYGTAAGQVVALNGTAQLPAVDGSLLTNVNATKLGGRTVASTAPTNGQLLGWDATTTQWEPTPANATVSFPLLASPAGSATAPAYSFASGSGTGLFSPSTNVLAFSSAGTTSMTVLANGNVGVGTSAPTNPLQVNDPIGGAISIPLLVSGSATLGATVLSIVNTNSGAHQSAELLFKHNSGNVYAIETDYLGGGLSNLAFLNSGGIMTMVIDSANNVGIGTAAPAAFLDLYGTGAQSAMLVPRDTAANRPSGVNGMIRYNTSGNVIEAFANGSWQSLAAGSGVGTVQSITGGTGLLGGTISTAGTLNVNVGTAPLQIVQENASAQIAQSPGSATFPAYAFANSTSTGLFSPGAGTAALATNGTPRLTIDGAGNVGIGTSTPVINLDVTGAGAQIRVKDTGGGTDLRLNTSGGQGGVGTYSANDLYLSTDSTERLRVTSGGSIGVGTFAPASILDVYATGTAASAIIVPRDLSTTRPLNAVNGMIRYATDTSKFEVYQSGSWQNMLGGSASSLAFNALTNANAVNTIDNTTYAQTWNWSTATTQSPLSINANSLTTGSGLNLTTSSNNLNSTNGLLDVANTGTSTSGVLARFQSNSTAGSGVTILDNGNVGVGTTAPLTTFDVRSDLGASPTTWAANIMIGNPTASGDAVRLRFDDGVNGKATIESAQETGAGDGYLAFKTRNPSFITERMRITSAGNVGIGSSSPMAALDVNVTGTTSSIIVPRDTAANRPTGVNGMLRYNTTAGAFEFFQNNAWVGYNTGSAGAVSFPLLASPQTASPGAPSYSFSGNANTGLFSPATNQVAISAAGTTVMTINAAGNVGIGTTLPANQVDVRKTLTNTSFVDLSEYWVNFNPSGAQSFGDQSAIRTDAFYTSSNNSNGSVNGVNAASYAQGAGTVNILTGVSAAATQNSSAQVANANGIRSTAVTYAGNIYEADGIYSQVVNSGTGTISFARGLYSIVTQTSSGVNTNGYGLYVDTIQGATNYGVYQKDALNQNYFGGKLGIGTTTAGAELDVYATGAQSAIIVPRDTAANRPTGVDGMLRYNTTAGAFEFFQNNVWVSYNTGTAGTLSFPLLASPQTASPGAPSYSFSGNANTGLFSPATNQVALATSGATALTINSNGDVGIGSSTPGARLDVFKSDVSSNVNLNAVYAPAVTGSSSSSFIGSFNQLNWTTSFNDTSWLWGGINRVNTIAGQTGTLSNLMGGMNNVYHNGNQNVSGEMTGMQADADLYGSGLVNTAQGGEFFVHNSGSGTINQAIGVHASVANLSTGAIVSSYGVYVDSLAGSSAWSIYASDSTASSYFASTVGIGTNQPQAGLDINTVGTARSALIVPRDIAANRPTGVNGMVRYNTTASAFEFFQNNAWVNFGTGSSSGTVISITSGTGLAGGTITSSGTINVNVGTGAGQIEQLNANSQSVLANGSVTAPSYSFANSTGAGLFSPSTNKISLVTNGTAAFTVDATGFIGIGSLTPLAALDIVALGTAASAMIVPRDTAANRPSGVNGMIRYNTSAAALESFVNGAWQSVAVGSGVGTVNNIITSTGLLGGPITSSGTISVNVGTGVSQIVQENASAQILQSAGSVSAPAYAFGNGSSTGLYSPGAGTATFATNGVARLTLDGAGNVGVGTSAPGGAFEISSGGVSRFLLGPGNFDGIIIGQRLANDGFIDLGFGSVNNKIESGVATNDLRFFANGAERVRILAIGNVGVGTTAPASILDVYATGTASAILVPRDTSTNRPTGINGMFRYNTTTASFEFFQNNVWVNYGTGTSSGTVTSITNGTGLIGGTITSTGTLSVNVGTGVSQIVQENASAQIIQSAGSVSAPAYAFGNGSSTGLYSPGAGTATFATNGVARFTLDGAGNVGVGTTSPSATLDIQASSPTLKVTATAGADAGISVLGGGVGNEYLKIGNKYIYNATTSNTALYIGNNLTSSQLTVDQYGNLGVGTAAPGAILDVYGTATQSAVLVPRDTTANRPSGTNGMFRYNTTTASFEFFQNSAWINYGTGSSSGGVTSLTSGTGLLGGTITSTGTLNVNVGTGAGQIAQLNSNAQLALANGNATAPSHSFANSTSTGLYSPGAGTATLATNGTARITFDGAGNVGIGTTSPATLLDLELTSASSNGISVTNSGAGNAVVYVQSFGAAFPLLQLNQSEGTRASPSATLSGDYIGAIQFQGRGNSSSIVGGGGLVSLAEATFTATSAPAALLFQTSGSGSTSATERVRITSGGNFGIGTTAPASILDVYATGTQSAILAPRDTSSNRPTGINGMFRYNTSNAAFEFFQNNTWVAYNTGASSGTVVSIASGSGLTGGPITSNGTLTVNMGTGSGQVVQLNANAQIALNNGTATNPSHSFANSLGAGLFSPATNKISLATSGTTAVTVDTNGFVGIGSTTPQAVLDIVTLGTAGSAIIVPRDTAANRPVGVNGMIRYNTSTSGMESFVNGAWANFTFGSGVGTVQSIATSTGLIGGTITSNGTISVNAGTGATQIVQENASAQIIQNVGSVGAPAYSFSGNTSTGIFAPATSKLSLVTNGTAALNIDANGYVGIGTTAPSQKLDVRGTIRLANSDFVASTTGTLLDNYLGASSGNTYAGFQGYTNGGTSPANIVLNPVSGNVGVGTASPAYPLDVNGGINIEGSNLLSFGARGNFHNDGTNQSLINYNGASVFYNHVGSTGTALAYRFQGTTSDTPLIDIDNNGNVGIGTITPAQALDVNGNVHISGLITQDAWTAVTFANSWVNYNSGYAPVAYFKDKNGIVHLRGLATSGTCGQAMFTFPAGYRPAYNLLFSTISNNASARVDLSATGIFTVGSGGGGCSNVWFSVDGISFLAEQ